MGRKATAKKRRRDQADNESRYRLPALVGAWVVCVAVAIAVLVVGLSALWRGIAGMDEFCIDPLDITIESKWVKSDALMREILANDSSGVLSRRWSVFTPELATHVARGYGRCPWVRRVVSVEKVFPNHLEIVLDLREPYAVVRCAKTGRYYCVDDEGVVLSTKVYRLTRDRLTPLLPLIVAYDTEISPVPKERWRDITVLEGIKMLRLYREQFAGEVPITDIEVKKVHLADGAAYANAWLVLDSETQSRTRIFWGRTPSASGSIAEVSTPRKTAALLALVRKEGSRLREHRMIDLRWQQPKVE